MASAAISGRPPAFQHRQRSIDVTPASTFRSSPRLLVHLLCRSPDHSAVSTCFDPSSRTITRVDQRRVVVHGLSQVYLQDSIMPKCSMSDRAIVRLQASMVPSHELAHCCSRAQGTTHSPMLISGLQLRCTALREWLPSHSCILLHAPLSNLRFCRWLISLVSLLALSDSEAVEDYSWHFCSSFRARFE